MISDRQLRLLARAYRSVWRPDLSTEEEIWHAGEMVPIPSGLYVPAQAAADLPSGYLRPTCIDLFAGCGGASLGVIQAGFRVVAGMDNDPLAALTYLSNLGSYPLKMHFVSEEDERRFEAMVNRELKHGTIRSGIHRPADRPGVDHFWVGDIAQIHGLEMLAEIGMAVGEVDCIIGGPPCQGFSTANPHRHPGDPRNSLVLEFARLVCEIKPKTMIMENVPGILSTVTPDGIPVMDELARVLEDGGFGVRDAFLKAVKMQHGSVGLLRGKKRPKRKRPKHNAGATEME